jgi:hypothetical protein
VGGIFYGNRPEGAAENRFARFRCPFSRRHGTQTYYLAGLAKYARDFATEDICGLKGQENDSPGFSLGGIFYGNRPEGAAENRFARFRSPPVRDKASRQGLRQLDHKKEGRQTFRL